MTRRLGSIEQLEPRMMLSGGTIQLGPQTDFVDQPYVEVEMFADDVGIGPYGSSLGLFPYNRMLLDTGANSIMIVSDAAVELHSNGYQTEGTYRELGIAGYTEFDLSAPYRFDISGTDGVTHSLPQTADQVRILSNPDLHLGGQAASEGGIPGIVGMPGMVDRVTTLDMSGWIEITDLFDISPIEVAFSEGEDALPESNGHRYSVAVDDRISFDAEEGLPPDSPPDAPLPVWAPVPFLTAVLEHQDKTTSASFLLDTGAQHTLISTQLALDAGLDADGDGNFDNEALYFEEIGGIGGTIRVPILSLERLRIPTEQDVDLVWMGADPDDPDDLGLQVLVLDVAQGIDGVLGVDMLMSGLGFLFDPDTWEIVVEGAPYFDQIHFDFRSMRDGSGTLYFDLNPIYDEVILDDSAEVAGRYVFYNDSEFDTDAGDGAIATDKWALLPGQTASFANYTSYDRGINGIIIDVDNLADSAALSTDDFEFRVGNSSDLSTWRDAPDPRPISVGDVAGEHRVTITWEDNLIEGEWLQVTVLDTANTGLDKPDVFYFGNAIGEAGNSQRALVNASDQILARSNQNDPQSLTDIKNPYDFNRDRVVNATDEILARNHQTGPFTALRMIHAPETLVPAPLMEAPLPPPNSTPAGELTQLDWLFTVEQSGSARQSSDRDTAAAAVDRLLATYWS